MALGIGAVSGVFTLFAPAVLPTIAVVLFTVVGVLLTYVASEAKGALGDKRLEQAHSEINSANKRADEAVQAAATERLERIKLETRLADRTMEDNEEKALASAIAPFHGQMYRCTTFWDLREPLAFTNRVHHILQSAGWVYMRDVQQGFLLGGLEGVEVFAHPEAPGRVLLAADALATALSALGHLTKRKPAGGEVHDYVSINFGTKPL
ncbi:MAG: hypothetical protein ACOH2N_00290 [Devosia sp.]